MLGVCCFDSRHFCQTVWDWWGFFLCSVMVAVAAHDGPPGINMAANICFLCKGTASKLLCDFIESSVWRRSVNTIDKIRTLTKSFSVMDVCVQIPPEFAGSQANTTRIDSTSLEPLCLLLYIFIAYRCLLLMKRLYRKKTWAALVHPVNALQFVQTQQSEEEHTELQEGRYLMDSALH